MSLAKTWRKRSILTPSKASKVLKSLTSDVSLFRASSSTTRALSSLCRLLAFSCSASHLEARVSNSRVLRIAR